MAQNDIMPLINERIKSIIDTSYGGNVRKFSQAIGLSDSSKINRLFNKDSRNNCYPYPSIYIVELISDKLGYTTDYLIKGIDAKTSVNNINIDNSKNVDGKNNTMSDNCNNSNIDYNDIIKKQQEQIDMLLKMLASK